MSNSPWRSVEEMVRLELSRASLTIDVRQPNSGLSDVRVDGRSLADTALLGVELSVEHPQFAPGSVDGYVRGGDLVATYADCPSAAMRAQIYWRAASHDPGSAIAAVELVTSVQTSLLDSCPRLSTRTRLRAGEAWRLDDSQLAKFVPSLLGAESESKGALSDLPQCFLLRSADSDVSYAEMVHPADAGNSHCTRDDQGMITLAHQLFVERLEKGVILRARVLGVLLDRADDMAQAAAHYRAFASAALPLTT